MNPDPTTLAPVSARVRAQLQRICAPVVVGVPPVNAFRDMVQLPDGEIRHYGYRFDGADRQAIYISSRDGGLSWQEYPAPPDCPGACVQSPWSGDWLTLVWPALYRPHEKPAGRPQDAAPLGMTEGFYACRSTRGLDGPFTATRITEQNHIMPRQPMPLRARRRWVVACQCNTPEGEYHPVVFRSDDDGLTWGRTVVDTVPAHRVEWPHRGVRWQNYACEPTIVELSSGRLWMIMRTSQDRHYQAFSDDAGTTWTKPEPSRFYGTITMPTLFRLGDGRILFFWCNTTPLPELDHDAQPELLDWEREGKGEDFFTNRDAFHAAISEDDGRTWVGFRELLLNERRNDADFRASGGNADSLDKSVHQSQALELPEGKVLVSVGQHAVSRRLLIFDPAWLYEPGREDDFRLGLGGWSVQQYVKSIAGDFRGFAGHCAYNRRPGAQLIPDPDGTQREVLHVARYADPRLVHEPQGAVWNFPAGRAGEVRLHLRLPAGSQGFRLCLLDRWFNPVDPVAHHFAPYVVVVDAEGRINQTATVMLRDVWQVLTLQWSNAAKAPARLRFEGTQDWLAAPLQRPSENGICYLHVQSLAATADLAGVLIREVDASL